MENHGIRALQHAQQIVAAYPGRGSATRAEARAAAYVQQTLQKLGLTDIRVQSFSGLRSIWLFLSTAFGLALSGHAAFWLLRHPIGPVPALAITLAAFAAAGFLLWRKTSFKSYPLKDGLPHGPSQNVLAVIPPRQETQQQVVLTANLDSHRAVWWFASDVLVQLYQKLTPVAVYGLAGAPLLYTLAVLTGWQVFAWLALIPALVQFLVWFTGVTADLGAYSSGANDNASSIGILLTLAERLLQAPLEQTEVWLAFTGCGASGCEGMQTLLAEHGPELNEALFLNFERVGIGDRLAALGAGGELEQLILESGKQTGLQPAQGGRTEAFSQGQLLKKRGFASIHIQSLRERTNLPPEWRRLTDTADRLQESALDRAQDFAWAVMEIYRPANKSFSRTPAAAGGKDRINVS